jgi:hypothetical protein
VNKHLLSACIAHFEGLISEKASNTCLIPETALLMALERSSISKLVVAYTTHETASTTADLPVTGSLRIAKGIINIIVFPMIAMCLMGMLILGQLRH